MNWQDIALAAAGAIGAVTAVVHGVIVQRIMVRPFEAFAVADRRVGEPVRRLVPVLLHMSTVFWLLGGLALVALAFGVAPQARLATSLFVGATFLFGVVGNFWGTRGRHPGWILLGVAVLLIGFANSAAFQGG